MCPYFDTMEEIFGHKTNVVPPFIYESRLDNDQEIESHQLGIDEPNQSDDYSNGRSLCEDNENVDTSIYGNDDQGNGLVADDYTCEEYLDEFSEVERGAFMVDQASGSIVLENEVIDLRQEFTNLAEVIVSPSNVSEVSRFKKLLVTAPPNSTPKSKPSQKSDKDNISRFKKRLMISPVAETDKTMPRNSSSILADAQNKKAEAILGRNDIEKTRAENEKLYKLEEVSLAKDKFSFEKENRKSDLELRKMEMDLREKEIQSRERIEMYRIEVEAKKSLEIAKLRHENM